MVNGIRLVSRVYVPTPEAAITAANQTYASSRNRAFQAFQALKDNQQIPHVGFTCMLPYFAVTTATDRERLAATATQRLRSALEIKKKQKQKKTKTNKAQLIFKLYLR